MNYIKSAIRKSYRIIAKRSLNQLSGVDNESARRIQTALRSAIDGNKTPDEAAWITKIEGRRGSLRKLDTEIIKKDFGAVSGASPTGTSTDDPVIQRTTVGDICQAACKPELWTSFLFHLVRQFDARQIVELGSALGISASYMAAAQVLNGDGRTLTMEGDESVADVAEATFVDVGLENVTLVRGSFSDTLNGAIEKLDFVDFAFIDGHHDGEATLAYFAQLKPKLAPRAVIVFDDISWSDSMRSAWAELKNDSSISLAVDLQAMGVCVVDSSIKNQTCITIPMRYA